MRIGDLFSMQNILLVMTLVSGAACHSSTHAGGAKPAEKPMDIEKITWQLAEVGGTPAEPVPADARAAHVRLDPAEKRASGFSGVNSFNGTYELNGQAVKFGPMAMTRRAGPPALMRQESSFTQALTNTTSWRGVNEKTIEFLDSTGKTLAKLSRSAGAE